MKNARYFIAYATGLNIIKTAHCCHNAEILGQSELKGYRLLFRGKPELALATIEQAEAYTVPVLVWLLTGDDERNLDRELQCPEVYTKRQLIVVVDGKNVDGFIYVLKDSPPIGQPSCEYLNTLLDGYEDNAFDPTAVNKHWNLHLNKTKAIAKLRWLFYIQIEVKNERAKFWHRN